jgi:hypothetical protein
MNEDLENRIHQLEKANESLGDLLECVILQIQAVRRDLKRVVHKDITKAEFIDNAIKHLRCPSDFKEKHDALKARGY